MADQGLHIDRRPKTLAEVFNQKSIVGRLEGELKSGTFPHASMFVGSSGVGKTTVARILKDELGCDQLDYVEQNMADKRGIDDVRGLAQTINMTPMGKCRVYVLDECHQITKTGQQALLKMLEDCPKHAYFILLTSEPARMIKAVKTRCATYKFETMTRKDTEVFVSSVMEDLGKVDFKNDPPKKQSFFKELAEEIGRHAGGSQRMALVMLQGALACPNPKAALASVGNHTADDKDAWDLFQALCDTNWPKARAVLKVMYDQLQDDHEGPRRQIIGMAAGGLVKGSKTSDDQLLHIIDCLESNNFDSGRGGFIAGCYAAAQGA